MLQKTCMTSLSLAAHFSVVGRHGAKSNIGMSNIFSRSIMTWNNQFATKNVCQRLLPPSARGYTMTANFSPLTMVSSRSQSVGVARKITGNFLSLRERVATSLLSLIGVPRPTTVPQSLYGLSMRETTKSQIFSSNSSSIFSWAIWLIKRTYQPSLLKKKRQCGYMKRRQSVGGRRILKRRRQKGRKRLFGA